MNPIWIGVLTGCFALLGVGLTLRFEDKRSVLAHKRWLADHFLDEKLGSLRRLHTALVDCHFTLNLYGNVTPETLGQFKEDVAPKVDLYLNAMVMASIYVNEEENDVFSQALGAFRQANTAIWLSLPKDQNPQAGYAFSDGTKNLNWERFNKTYENALKLLAEKLNPKSILRDIEEADISS